jgi:hypothetical protein
MPTRAGRNDVKPQLFRHAIAKSYSHALSENAQLLCLIIKMFAQSQPGKILKSKSVA